MTAPRRRTAVMTTSEPAAPLDIAALEALQRKVLWLSSLVIHHANHVRPNEDGIKVGGHQASSASLATVMTALYFRVLRPEDRVAVKPHASPVFHAIQYLLGNQTLENLKAFRGFGGAQSYPSRTKDADDVDFSTGSVGLGVAITAFASLVQDYLDARGWKRDWPTGRMVALLGDAELDEGNVFECLLEGWKHDLRNCWWVIDYNRQSLDSIVSDELFQKHAAVFASLGWEVVFLKYGRRLRRAFARPGGERLRAWIDDCPNMLYSALTFQGGAAFRQQLRADLADAPATLALVEELDDRDLHRLMTDLGGHCMETVVEAFETAPTEKPVCFIAYTVKGHGLPFQGHKDNHSGLMTKEQMRRFQDELGIREGEEWEPFAGLDAEPEAIAMTPRIWSAIVSVNRAVNARIRAVTDEEHWAVPDRWDLPSDRLGDCEDFQLLKRKLLAAEGLPRRAMRMTVVVDEKGEGHAVLMVRTDRGDLVLDNKTNSVLPWHRTGYVFVKRESQDRLGWVSLGGATSPIATANR